MAQPSPRPSLPQRVLSEFGSYLDDLWNTGGQSLPEWINEGQPNSIVLGATQASYRQACRRWARGGFDPNERRDDWYSEICKPYLQDIGEWPGDETVSQPFTGGQCEGVEYFFAYNWTDANGNTGESSGGPYVGPLSGLRVEENLNIEGNYTGISDIYITDGLGVERLFKDNGETGLPRSDRNYRAVRADGQPDICGNPPPEVRGREPIGEPMTPRPPKTPPEIDIDIDFEFFPDSQIQICVGGTCGTKRDPFDRPLGDGGDGDEAVPGSPGDGGDTGDGGETEGEAPEGEVLVGLKINFLGVPVQPKLYTDDVHRGVAYVYMGFPGQLDQDFAGSMLADGQFVFAEKEGLTAWRVRANVGYNLQVIPYYKPKESAE